MNKTTVLVLIAALVLTSAAVIAQNGPTPSAMPAVPKGVFPNGFKPPVMKMMVASSDGGAIVIAGDKIMKYDKDLNLVNAVDLKVD